MEIVPRPFGQVLGDAINRYGRIWKPLTSTALIVYIPLGVLTLLIFQMTGANDFLELAITDPEALSNLPTEVFLEVSQPFILAIMIVVGLGSIAALFVYLAVHSVVVSDISQDPISGAVARRHAWGRMGSGLIAGFIGLIVIGLIFAIGLTIWIIPLAVVGTPNATSTLLAVVLLLALVGPGVWLLISFSMTTSVIAIERAGPIRALSRSHNLVKGRWWPTLGFLLMVGLLGSVAIQLIQLVAIPLSAVGELASGVSYLVLALGVGSQGLIVAGIAAMYTAWYIDLRARQQELLSEDLH